MEIITNIFGGTAAAIVLVSVLTRFLPNEKLYMWGYEWGLSLSTFATGKIGYAWNKIEDFICNSIGILFNGFRDGLNADDGDGGIIAPNPPENEKKTKKVRR
jgi:hypothetical protein